MLDNITPIKSDREALKEIQTIIAAKSEAVKRHQVRAVLLISRDQKLAVKIGMKKGVSEIYCFLKRIK